MNHEAILISWVGVRTERSRGGTPAAPCVRCQCDRVGSKFSRGLSKKNQLRMRWAMQPHLDFSQLCNDLFWLGSLRNDSAPSIRSQDQLKRWTASPGASSVSADYDADTPILSSGQISIAQFLG